ncbi:unnamed protein product [Cylicocyclus nassatus]|uniref:Apple domain-containing protein n=1 Tax=Cylicocyclus nassatus TaxID=53992 RepID=A0AA36M6V4_CYLNA|nr:unnamed protein product [Cylicocyclus nassatus]
MSASRWIFPLLVLSNTAQASNSEGIEDITSDNVYQSDDFPSPPNLGNAIYSPARQKPIKNNNILQNYYEKKRAKQHKLNNYSVPPMTLRDTTDESTRSGGSGYGVPQSPSTPNYKVVREADEDRQVIAGIPDLNDPCFRRYVDCIIVNAQPYERRSSFSLMNCKAHCLQSQTGTYTCRSFVYDNINQVCDLFAHVGDQAPARLLKFQTRDYFEPTQAYHCLNPITTTTIQYTTEATTTQSTTVATLPMRPTPPLDQVVAHASQLDRRENFEEAVKTVETESLVEQKFFDKSPKAPTYCPPGKRISFLQTEGFELYNNDDIILAVSSVSECISACERNQISGQALDCRSFDYSDSTCSFSKETAVPVGNGQLKQRNDTTYYEKICVAESATKNCSPTFVRFPQMVLVGFAEAVADAATFEACFEYCMESQTRFGFNCSSGMYFFEEAQLNCILNSEDRHTQSDLFAEENTDIVDYFEVGCQKPPPQPTRPRMRSAKTFSVPELLVVAAETQTDWSKCEDGFQHRRRDCDDPDQCGLESRICGDEPLIEMRPEKKTRDKYDDFPTPEDIAKVKADVLAHGLRCRADVCCPVFKGCAVGLRLNSNLKKLEWCKKPCANKRRRKH